jgi:hypothetical protein
MTTDDRSEAVILQKDGIAMSGTREDRDRCLYPKGGGR